MGMTGMPNDLKQDDLRSTVLDLRDFKMTVTGGGGFLGKAILDSLRKRGVADEQVFVPSRKDYDLTTEAGVERMYRDSRPDVVIHLAADVGGIGANRLHPGRFFYANMAMGLHLIEYARRNRIKKFVHTGTVCAYPKFTPVPFKEEDLWNGYPEETNAPYGIAKKSMFVMLEAYKQEYGLASAVVVPVNLYGPGDNFDPNSSHVIPALIRKCEEARINREDHITCWGTGEASREFLFMEDAAEGLIRVTEQIDDPDPINLGTGQEIKIKNLVQLIAGLCGFTGRIEWDPSKPDGQPRRCLDTTRAKERLGWSANTSFEEGLKRTVGWWREQHPEPSGAK